MGPGKAQHKAAVRVYVVLFFRDLLGAQGRAEADGAGGCCFGGGELFWDPLAGPKPTLGVLNLQNYHAQVRSFEDYAKVMPHVSLVQAFSGDGLGGCCLLGGLGDSLGIALGNGCAGWFG